MADPFKTDPIRRIRELLCGLELDDGQCTELVRAVELRHRPSERSNERKELRLFVTETDALIIRNALNRLKLDFAEVSTDPRLARVAQYVSSQIAIAFGKWKVQGTEKIDIFEHAISLLKKMRERETEWNKIATPTSAVWYPEQEEIDELLKMLNEND